SWYGPAFWAWYVTASTNQFCREKQRTTFLNGQGNRDRRINLHRRSQHHVTWQNFWDRKARVDLVLGKCQLLEKRKVIIRKLSKGYKQRVGIAQAIVHDPPVIILDEPTVGLDPKQIIEVRNLIKSLAGEHTIILSTHILPEVSITCDRATIINRGRIVANNITTATPAGSSYEIEIEGDRDSLLEILQQLPEVEQAAKVGDNLLKIVGQAGTNLGAELARIVVNNGYNLLEMRRTRKTLEDIFLEVIGSGESNQQEERNDQ
ncbi:MAG: ATP-binding cassette domain-containing protein, partial [Microcystis aeruginosa]